VEQRQFSRVAFTADVRITAGYTTVEVRTTDLSLGGMRLSTPGRIPVQETVDVLIEVPETCPSCSISARAVVVRHDDQGKGLAFLGMGLESFFTLARLVSGVLGDQARAARELLDFLTGPSGRHTEPSPYLTRSCRQRLPVGGRSDPGRPGCVSMSQLSEIHQTRPRLTNHRSYS
jgi:hypothetical protein